MPRRDVWLDPGVGRSPETMWERAARRVVVGALLVVVVAFMFGFPLLERRMHISALRTGAPEHWGSHLAALCGIRGGRGDLYEHLQTLEGEPRRQLLGALVERGCLEDMSADVQTEAYFMEEGRQEESAVAAAPPAWLIGVLERAGEELGRAAPGEPHAARALRVLERRWGTLGPTQRRRFALGIARQLPDPIARRLLLLDGALFIPALFEHLGGAPADAVAAARGLELLTPLMDPAQKLELELWLANAGPLAAEVSAGAAPEGVAPPSSATSPAATVASPASAEAPSWEGPPAPAPGEPASAPQLPPPLPEVEPVLPQPEVAPEPPVSAAPESPSSAASTAAPASAPASVPASAPASTPVSAPVSAPASAPASAPSTAAPVAPGSAAAPSGEAPEGSSEGE